jgi:hypothetical protein
MYAVGQLQFGRNGAPDPGIRRDRPVPPWYAVRKGVMPPSGLAYARPTRGDKGNVLCEQLGDPPR